jgi:hypothetical protein
MKQNQVAGLALILCSLLFIGMIFFHQQLSTTAFYIGMAAIYCTGALFFFLYAQRYSKVKRWGLLLVFIVPNVLLLLWNFMRH